jgi:hypothetical protein
MANNNKYSPSNVNLSNKYNSMFSTNSKIQIIPTSDIDVNKFSLNSNNCDKQNSENPLTDPMMETQSTKIKTWEFS